MLIKVFFCLIISYLRIKSYNVLNYNNCSTDWSFPEYNEQTKINRMTHLYNCMTSSESHSWRTLVATSDDSVPSY